jgi:ABC-2 type transport system permease protein
MRYWLQVYRANLGATMAEMAQYRGMLIIWAVWEFVGPLIALAVWSAASEARGGVITGQRGASYARADFAAYFLVLMVFSHLTMSWDAFEFAWRVRDGRLSPRLLKPIHVIHLDIAYNIGYKLITSAILLPVWITLFLLLKPSPPAHWYAPILALPALGLAAALQYIWQYCLALIAFWTTRVEAINQFYYVMDGFLAGRLAPLSLMPGWIGVVALYSPFRGMGAFPVELTLGRLPPEAILPGFALQIVWIAVGLLVFRVLWAAGIKQYSAVGA